MVKNASRKKLSLRMENKNILLKTTKKTSPIKRNKFHWIFWLLLSVISTVLWGLVIIYLSPDSNIPFMNVQFATLILFFYLLFCMFFFWVTLITKSKAHGILIASFFVIYLLFRLNNLTNPFFLILLLALFVMMELFISYKR